MNSQFTILRLIKDLFLYAFIAYTTFARINYLNVFFYISLILLFRFACTWASMCSLVREMETLRFIVDTTDRRSGKVRNYMQENEQKFSVFNCPPFLFLSYLVVVFFLLLPLFSLSSEFFISFHFIINNVDEKKKRSRGFEAKTPCLYIMRTVSRPCRLPRQSRHLSWCLSCAGRILCCCQ